MNVSNYLEHSGYVLDDRPSRTLEKRRLEENEFFANINSKKNSSLFSRLLRSHCRSVFVCNIKEFDCVWRRGDVRCLSRNFIVSWCLHALLCRWRLHKFCSVAIIIQTTSVVQIQQSVRCVCLCVRTIALKQIIITFLFWWSWLSVSFWSHVNIPYRSLSHLNVD